MSHYTGSYVKIMPHILQALHSEHMPLLRKDKMGKVTDGSMCISDTTCRHILIIQPLSIIAILDCLLSKLPHVRNFLKGLAPSRLIVIVGFGIQFHVCVSS